MAVFVSRNESSDRLLGRDVKVRVAEIAVGQPKSITDSFLSELLTGDIGSDRLDYLLRDSHHLGVAYGYYDLHRLLNTLFARHNTEKDGPELAIEEGGLHAAEGFLLARYFMFLDVYFHKTRRILDAHLTEFLKDWLPDETYPESLDAFLKLDDIKLLNSLVDNDGELAKRVISRQFFRSSFETVDHPEAAELVAFKWLQNDVISEFRAENIRIDEAEKAPYSYTAPPIFVKTSRGYQSLPERSSLVNNLRTIQKKRIYANQNVRSEVELFCANRWAEILP